MRIWGLIAICAAMPALAGCAGEQSMMLGPQAAGLATTGGLPGGQAGSANAARLEAEAEQDARQQLRKNRASKVLAAIALERVTGRKPDPGRLVD